MKHFIRSVIFLVVFCLLFSFIQMTLQPKWGQNSSGAHETINSKGFYSEPKNSMDVMLYGSSFVFFGTSPLTMWENFGFSSYVRGSANQLPYFTYYMMKDSLLHQHPKVIVLEVGQFYNEFHPADDEWIARRALDYMPLNAIKLEAVSNLDLSGTDQTKLSYVFPLLRYHDRWHDLEANDFSYYDYPPHNYIKGQYDGKSIYKVTFPDDFMKYTSEVMELPEGNREIFDRIYQLCAEKGIELVMLKTPVYGWDYAKHNGLQALADEHGLLFLDYNVPEYYDAAGINASEDFNYNQYHLRMSGADKLSRHMGQILKESYDLPDHRQEKKYSQWNKDLDQYIDYSLKNKTAVLADPVLLSAASDESGITVSWEEVPRAKVYAVFRKTADTAWLRLADVPGSSFLDSTAEQDTEYFYTVKAVRDANISFCDPNGIRITRTSMPNLVYKVDQIPKPEAAAPKEEIKALDAPVLSEIRATEDGIVIVWEAVEEADTYAVFRRTDGEKNYLTLGKVIDTSFCDMSAEKGVTYTYTIKAIRGTEVSGCDVNGLNISY